MIYVTGDIHGDLERFRSKALHKLKRKDILLICGDFGFVWKNDKAERKLLRWIASRRYTTLFVEGAHENFSLLEKFPEEEKFGGKVRKLGKNLYQMIRGEVYEMEGKRIFAFGGGELDEDEDRVEGVNWYVGEQVSQADMERAEKNLARYDWEVDYFITHDPSSQVKSFMSMDSDQYTKMHTFLDEISEKTHYRHWYFGHYHVDRRVSPSLTAVFKSVVLAE